MNSWKYLKGFGTQIQPSAVILGARQLCIEKPVDALVADYRAAGLNRQPLGHLLRRPACAQSGQDRGAQLPLAFQLRAAPPPGAGLLIRTGGCVGPLGSLNSGLSREQSSMARDPELLQFAGARPTCLEDLQSNTALQGKAVCTFSPWQHLCKLVLHLICESRVSRGSRAGNLGVQAPCSRQLSSEVSDSIRSGVENVPLTADHTAGVLFYRGAL